MDVRNNLKWFIKKKDVWSKISWLEIADIRSDLLKSNYDAVYIGLDD